MTLVLVGHKGVGKTSLGRSLAKSLSASFFDTDEMLIKAYDGIEKSPREIAYQIGEEQFRKLEEEVIEKLMQITKPSSIIALGGGSLLSKKTRECLKIYQAIVCLYLPFESWRNRLFEYPSYASDEKSLRASYEDRLKVFRSMSLIWTDGNSSNILSILKQLYLAFHPFDEVETHPFRGGRKPRSSFCCFNSC